MKFFGTLIILAITGFSSHAETILTNTYFVVSDEFSENVPKGECHIKGVVYEGSSVKTVQGAYVGNFPRTTYAHTDHDGTYELSISSEDSVLYLFHSTYGEIVCNNYDFKSQHMVTINFRTIDLDGTDIIPVMEVAEKPVIYLYSAKPLQANLELKFKGDLSFTYPTYENGWTANVLPGGGVEVNDVYYPYLFWEGKQERLYFETTDNKELEGYFIDTDSTINFLEATLSQLGLNSTEQTDFITYWGPRLMQHNFATIQFFVDESYTSKIGDLIITPKPNAIRRVYMVFQGSEFGFTPGLIKAPSLPSFKRTGFTVLEWGGTELSTLEVN